ncbi:MAG: helix-turn-helix domain-containing protein [Candidatus Kapaibacterium sp.]
MICLTGGTIPEKSMIAERLKQIRLARGLSLDALVEEMGGVVTKQAISKYETGKAQPTPTVLQSLAKTLGVKAAELLRPPQVAVDFIAYRKGAGLRKKEQVQVENLIERVLEERVRLQEMTGEVGVFNLPIQKFEIKSVEDAEKAAAKLREQWKLGDAPIANVVAMLEDHLIHVVEIDADEKFDGISAITNDQHGKPRGAAVVSRRGLPGERQRMNLAHELGHIVMDVPEDVDEEKAAFRFAGAFLAPADALQREVGLRRGFVQGEELVMLKLKYGISVQALLYRLQALGIIGPSHYRQWCIAINKQGYRKQEPYELEAEKPQWLRRTVLRALSEGLMNREDAERVLGDELSEDALSPRILERKELTKMGVEERRKILARQVTDFAESTPSKSIPSSSKNGSRKR